MAMVLYFLAFFGGLAMIFSFFGLGSIFSIVAFSKNKLDIGFRIILGLLIFLLVGGYLNFFKVISKLSLLGFLAFGLVFGLFFVIYYRKTIVSHFLSLLVNLKKDKVFAGLFLLVLILSLLRYSSSVSFFPFHGTDDYHGYLVFPAKMIQTGSLGNDPFSERRIVSSLGGGYLLDAAVLSFSSFKNLHIVDNGIGFLLLLILLAGFLKKLGFERKKILLLLLLLLIIPTPSRNVTSFFLSAALFFSFFRFLYDKNFIKGAQATLFVSLIVGSLIVLKTNMIIPASVLFVYFFFSTFYGQGKGVWLKNIFLSLAVFLIMLSPWMISMYQSSHTLLYPFLGKGYYGTSYGSFAGSFLVFNFYSLVRLFSEFFSSLSLFLPLLALGCLVFLSKHEKKTLLLFVFFASLLGIAALVYGVGGYSLYYYSFPFVLPTVLFLLAVLLVNQPVGNKFSIYALLVVFFIVGAFMQKSIATLNTVESDVSFDNGLKIGLVNSEMVSFDELVQYKNLQLAVPVGETILARLDKNFLFNFKRNNVFIIDLPGGSSLPPGLPYKQGGRKMADYLLSVGIKYVAYSYANEAGFSKKGSLGMTRAHVNPWLKTETENSQDFQDNLIELSQRGGIIYDDGKNFVLDISVKK